MIKNFLACLLFIFFIGCHLEDFIFPMPGCTYSLLKLNKNATLFYSISEAIMIDGNIFLKITATSLNNKKNEYDIPYWASITLSELENKGVIKLKHKDLFEGKMPEIKNNEAETLYLIKSSDIQNLRTSKYTIVSDIQNMTQKKYYLLSPSYKIIELIPQDDENNKVNFTIKPENIFNRIQDRSAPLISKYNRDVSRTSNVYDTNNISKYRYIFDYESVFFSDGKITLFYSLQPVDNNEQTTKTECCLSIPLEDIKDKDYINSDELMKYSVNNLKKTDLSKEMKTETIPIIPLQNYYEKEDIQRSSDIIFYTSQFPIIVDYEDDEVVFSSFPSISKNKILDLKIFAKTDEDFSSYTGRLYIPKEINREKSETPNYFIIDDYKKPRKWYSYFIIVPLLPLAVAGDIVIIGYDIAFWPFMSLAIWYGTRY